MEGSRTTLDEAARLWVAAGGGTLPVSGRSMRPTFEETARVWMEPSKTARFGDLLVSSTGEFLVIHRVVRVHRAPRQRAHQGPSYRTKGDGLPNLDPVLIAPDRVLGRAVGIERGGCRVRIDGAGGRVYALIAGSLSALEGFLYRFAYRIDRLLGHVRGADTPSGGPMLLRRALDRMGRAGFRLLDAALFRLLHGAGETATSKTHE